MSAPVLVLAEGDIPARVQMGASLGFHIVFACFGIAFPSVVLIAHWLGIRRHDGVALVLARRWSKVAAVVFAVGAVSGTVLSYELGLLWPVLMGRYGSAFGIPFAIEGIWFFVEAIFTAIYLYGWGRLRPWVHWWSGMPMVVAGLLGALAVVAANSWMNQPSGFTLQDGRVATVNPWAVVFNPATPYETPHMILAAYMVAGFVVAGVYATGLLRGRRDRYHRLGFLIPFWVGAVCAPLQVYVGDVLARAVANQQPIKFAAMELVDTTARGVPEWVGGVYWHGQVYFGVAIPYLDSLLVGFSPNTEVTGWDSVPPELRPPLPNLIHLSFDGMVAIGTLLVVLGAWQAWVWKFRRDVLSTRWFLIPAALAGAGSIVAMELGWITTEVGRQPWVVYGLLLTRDAVTPANGVPVTLAVTVVVYGVLTVTSIAVPWLMGRRWRAQDAVGAGADIVRAPYERPRRGEDARS
ncbi:cytochrome ubiquinol oxidase subunit I [Pseudonocardia sp. RS11V-5]|uniref:cytochrome ubiquinol oxidase subunit I n=1 Tax=Pseudonocardia terrae TaxID=2905831 RepID=UPI001E2CBAAC|nr:cytochrome ubiquinol oxidase subunit I [Pseudonocardia terrae]MCE3552012.1 cytochrome ubiquinol oxidase subunit I [Pseudonocardia terrae]